jgi:hypothetical protein
MRIVKEGKDNMTDNDQLEDLFCDLKLLCLSQFGGLKDRKIKVRF